MCGVCGVCGCDRRSPITLTSVSRSTDRPDRLDRPDRPSQKVGICQFCRPVANPRRFNDVDLILGTIGRKTYVSPPGQAGWPVWVAGWSAWCGGLSVERLGWCGGAVGGGDAKGGGTSTCAQPQPQTEANRPGRSQTHAMALNASAGLSNKEIVLASPETAALRIFRCCAHDAVLEQRHR